MAIGLDLGPRAELDRNRADLNATLKGNPLNSAVTAPKTTSASVDEIRATTSVDDLIKMDPSKMSPEQAGAYLDQMRALMGINQ